MTAQVSDQIEIDGISYSVLSRLPLPFSLKEQDIHPTMASTACYKGYFCHYRVEEDTLYLEDFYVCTAGAIYPPLFGKLPEKNRYTGETMFYMGCAVYRSLHLPSAYTGNLILGSGHLSEFYIHAGLQPTYSFEQLYEYTWADGRILSVLDRSAEGAAKREEIRAERERRLAEWEATHGGRRRK